jgi:hypothetical protein
MTGQWDDFTLLWAVIGFRMSLVDVDVDEKDDVIAALLYRICKLETRVDRSTMLWPTLGLGTFL